MALVTFESVATAAQALQAEGQRVSVRNVTGVLGGGSPNTVLKLLNEWKSGRPVVRVADAELDIKITTAIKEQMQRVATAAAVAAEERAATVEDDLDAVSQAQTVAERQIEALSTERDTAQAQAADFVHQFKEAAASAERAKGRAAIELAALHSDLLAERQRQEAAAGALVRAEVRLEAVPGLQMEVERLRALWQAESAARIAAEQQAAVLGAKLEAMTDRTTKAEARTELLEKQVQQSAQELSSTRVHVQAQQGALDAAAREITSAQEGAKEARAEAKKAGQEAAELRGAMSAQGKK